MRPHGFSRHVVIRHEDSRGYP